MPVFVAVIGERNSGKSTIIKSLTGCKDNSFRGTVTDNRTNSTIEVSCNSPQESTIDIAELRRHLRNATRPNSRGMICALQPTNPTKRLSLEVVLAEAMKVGLHIHAFVLDPTYGNGGSQSADVVKRLRTMKIKYKTLDAREFAHLNSVKINKKSKLVA